MDEEEQVHQEQKMNKPWEPASHNTKAAAAIRGGSMVKIKCSHSMPFGSEK
jgi:hypothetical protein